jgi:hypothetical protein
MTNDTDGTAQDAARLADTIGTALQQTLRMHLLISDIRVYYWMTIMLGTVLGAASTASVAFGTAWLALGVPGRAGLDPVAMVLIGAAVLLATLWLTIHRTSAYSVLLQTMRREVAILETATEEARDEARAIGMAIA